MHRVWSSCRQALQWVWRLRVMMSGERRQPTRSSSDDPRRADRRTWTWRAADLADSGGLSSWLMAGWRSEISRAAAASGRPSSLPHHQPSAKARVPSTICGRRLRDIFFPTHHPDFPTVLMNTAKSVTLTVFCINVRVRGH